MTLVTQLSTGWADVFSDSDQSWTSNWTKSGMSWTNTWTGSSRSWTVATALVSGAWLSTEAENYGVTTYCCDINYLLVLLPVSHDEDLDTLTMLAEPGHNDTSQSTLLIIWSQGAPPPFVTFTEEEEEII